MISIVVAISEVLALTVIQTRHRFHPKNRQSLCGGYTTVPWSSRHSYYRDPQAFLFAVDDNLVVRFNLRSQRTIAVSHHPTSVSVFGIDDMHIADRANENHCSLSKFPSSYEDQDTNGKRRKSLTKWKHFSVSEIEVYTLVQ